MCCTHGALGIATEPLPASVRIVFRMRWGVSNFDLYCVRVGSYMFTAEMALCIAHCGGGVGWVYVDAQKLHHNIHRSALKSVMRRFYAHAPTSSSRHTQQSSAYAAAALFFTSTTVCESAIDYYGVHTWPANAAAPAMAAAPCRAMSLRATAPLPVGNDSGLPSGAHFPMAAAGTSSASSPALLQNASDPLCELLAPCLLDAILAFAGETARGRQEPGDPRRLRSLIDQTVTRRLVSQPPRGRATRLCGTRSRGRSWWGNLPVV